jgi:hypothetical protein
MPGEEPVRHLIDEVDACASQAAQPVFDLVNEGG